MTWLGFINQHSFQNFNCPLHWILKVCTHNQHHIHQLVQPALAACSSTHLGLRSFICFDIKTWGTGVTSNWWLLREGGFLGRRVSNQCFFPLCSPQKAICPLTVLFSTVYSSKSHIIPYSAFFHCVLPKKPHWPLRSHMVVIQWKKAL